LVLLSLTTIYSLSYRESTSFSKPSLSNLYSDYSGGVSAKATDGQWTYSDPYAPTYGKTAINDNTGNTLGYWLPDTPEDWFTGNSERPSYIGMDWTNPSWVKQHGTPYDGGYVFDNNEINDPNLNWKSSSYRGNDPQRGGFLGKAAPIVGLASMFIPGMQGIGAGLLAANAASSGNWLGAASAALPFIPGVSGALGSAGSWLGDTAGISSELGTNLMSGLAGGAMSKLGGGDFLQGALTSGLSSAAAPQIKDWFNQSVFGNSAAADELFSSNATANSPNFTPDSNATSMWATGAESSPTQFQNNMSFDVNDNSLFPMSQEMVQLLLKWSHYQHQIQAQCPYVGLDLVL